MNIIAKKISDSLTDDKRMRVVAVHFENTDPPNQSSDEKTFGDNLTDNDVAIWVGKRIDSLAQVWALPIESIPVGGVLIDPIIVDDPPVVLWQKADFKARQAKAAVAAGYLQAGDKVVTDAIAAAQALFDPSFIGL